MRSNKVPFLDKPDTKDSAMQCENCFIHVEKLYDGEPWLLCIECKEADTRRKRLKKAEREFNNDSGGSK